MKEVPGHSVIQHTSNGAIDRLEMRTTATSWNLPSNWRARTAADAWYCRPAGSRTLRTSEWQHRTSALGWKLLLEAEATLHHSWRARHETMPRAHLSVVPYRASDQLFVQIGRCATRPTIVQPQPSFPGDCGFQRYKDIAIRHARKPSKPACRDCNHPFGWISASKS